MELMIVTSIAGVADMLAGYEGLHVVAGPSLRFAARLLASDQPPDAVYLEDSRGVLSELWDAVRAAQRRGLPVLLGLHGPAQAQRADFVDAGLAVTDMRDPAALAGWIAAALGARARASAAGQVTIAVAGAKGGIGKTLVTALLAEGLRRRGLCVLVVDGDLSNSGLVPTFRISSGFPSYLHARADGASAWTPENIRRYVLHHASGIDFLLGSEETADAQDLHLQEWQALMQGVRALHEYDVVLLDTGPEIKKRPYALLAARNQGYVVLPTPPGRKERTGVGNALRVFQAHTPDLSSRCLLLFMEPERGVAVTVNSVAPLFARSFPEARVLGTLPRAPRQVSLADEDGDHYLSPLDLLPHSRFSRAVHTLVDALAQHVGLRVPQPMPRSSLWQRLRGEHLSGVYAAATRTLSVEVRVS